jgi:hypothetical protein
VLDLGPTASGPEGWEDRPRRSRARDGLTIVVGILAALLVDAAWGWTVDRAEERQILADLRTELRAAARELEADQEARRRIQARARTFLDAREGGELPEATALDIHVISLIDYRFFTPPRSVLEDVVSSGRLTLIRSDGIRFALLGYAQEAERLRVVEQREMDFAAEQMEPFLSARVPLPTRLSYEAGGAEPGLSEAVTALSGDLTFRNLLELRWNRTDTSLRFAASVERWLETALAEIDAELGA